jgi:hypothetical protein
LHTIRGSADGGTDALPAPTGTDVYCCMVRNNAETQVLLTQLRGTPTAHWHVLEWCNSDSTTAQEAVEDALDALIPIEDYPTADVYPLRKSDAEPGVSLPRTHISSTTHEDPEFGTTRYHLYEVVGDPDTMPMELLGYTLTDVVGHPRCASRWFDVSHVRQSVEDPDQPPFSAKNETAPVVPLILDY